MRKRDAGTTHSYTQGTYMTVIPVAQTYTDIHTCVETPFTTQQTHTETQILRYRQGYAHDDTFSQIHRQKLLEIHKEHPAHHFKLKLHIIPHKMLIVYVCCGVLVISMCVKYMETGLKCEVTSHRHITQLFIKTSTTH